MLKRVLHNDTRVLTDRFSGDAPPDHGNITEVQTLLSRYLETRKRTEALCAALCREDYTVQPEAFISPPKWHLAHTSWFFEEMVLKRCDPAYPLFDRDFGYLFNSYYNAVGKRTKRALRGELTRPTVDVIYAYRTHVDEHMERCLSASLPQTLSERVLLGIQHEQQHQELLLTDLKYILGQNPTFPIYRSDLNTVNDRNEEMGWLNIPEGVYEIGSDSSGFSFDNERGRHKVYLHDFAISKSLVTNGDYMEFMASGGYGEFRHWLDEGWAWVCEEELRQPLYWQEVDGRWHHYTLGGLQAVDEQALLAHISFYEASAFASWKGCRLPTESEWEVASQQLKWGKRWEWTNSAYLPYPGFEPPSGALGEYNGKFMINQMVLRGASVATAEGHSRRTYRNFFHPHLQWQYTGIRLAKQR